MLICYDEDVVAARGLTEVKPSSGEADNHKLPSYRIALI